MFTDIYKKLELVDKIIDLTANNKIRWMRVIPNIDLYDPINRFLLEFINNYNSKLYLYKSKYTNNFFNLDESYVCDFLKGKIYLFRYKFAKSTIDLLAIQPEPDKKIVLINNPSDYTIESHMDLFVKLRELNFRISNSLDSPIDFIDAILRFEG